MLASIVRERVHQPTKVLFPFSTRKTGIDTIVSVQVRSGAFTLLTNSEWTIGDFVVEFRSAFIHTFE